MARGRDRELALLSSRRRPLPGRVGACRWLTRGGNGQIVELGRDTSGGTHLPSRGPRCYSCHPMPPKSPCPVSLSQFLEKAEPLKVVINGQEMLAEVKAFSTGSFGWYINGKTTVHRRRQAGVGADRHEPDRRRLEGSRALERARALTLRHVPEAIRSCAGLDRAGHLHGPEIHDHDLALGHRGHERALPSGAVTMPMGPRPIGMRPASWRLSASTTISLPRCCGPPSATTSEISTRLPSGVNLTRMGARPARAWCARPCPWPRR